MRTLLNKILCKLSAKSVNVSSNDKSSTWKDYREDLMTLYINLNGSNPNKPVSEGFAFYDWCIELENELRKIKRIAPNARLISDKDIYEFAISKFGIAK